MRKEWPGRAQGADANGAGALLPGPAGVAPVGVGGNLIPWRSLALGPFASVSSSRPNAALVSGPGSRLKLSRWLCVCNVRRRGMISALSKQEQRILAAARADGQRMPGWQIEFDWRSAARLAGIPPDSAPTILTGLRRFGFVGAIGPSRARLTEDGVEA